MDKRTYSRMDAGGSLLDKLYLSGVHPSVHPFRGKICCRMDRWICWRDFPSGKLLWPMSRIANDYNMVSFLSSLTASLTLGLGSISGGLAGVYRLIINGPISVISN